MSSRRAGRGQAWKTLIAVGFSATLGAAPATALDPDRSLAQLQHTAWTLEDGAPTQVTALAQTTDGYLWIGSSLGLFRFDGVEFERYSPPAGQKLPSYNIYALAATPDGGLWISFRPTGLGLIKDRRFTAYTDPGHLPGPEVFVFECDVDGRLWAGTQAGLSFRDAAGWHAIGPEWNLPQERAWSIFGDRRGTLWVGTRTTVYSLARGSRSFVRVDGDFAAVCSIAQAGDGRTWVADKTDERLRPLGGPRTLESRWSYVEPHDILFDRDGILWISGYREGVIRVRGHEGLSRRGLPDSTVRIEAVTRDQGLSGHQAYILLEDREGSIWVGTAGGIDRFRHNKLASVPLPVGFTSMTLLPADSGVVWVGSAGDWPIIRIQGESVTKHDMLRRVACVYRDPAGIAWWAGVHGLSRQDGFHTDSFPILPELNSWIWEVFPGSTPGLLWLSVDEYALVPVENGRIVPRAPPAGLPDDGPGASFAAPDGRVWLGYTNQVCVLDGERVISYAKEDGVDVGRVRVIRARAESLWIGGELGLQYFQAGRFRSVVGEDGAPFGTVSGIIATKSGDLWLNELLGIVHIRRHEVDTLLVDPHHRIRFRRYDHRDGMPGGGQMNWNCATAVEGTDGRLWFATDNGLVWADPAALATSDAPSVVVRSIVTDAASYAPSPGLKLPKGTRSLRVTYAAATLAEPERVRYRYRLAGLDDEWRDAGFGRTASFTRLKPGGYRFDVVGANADGAWSTPGASLAFAILPQFYQTSWFMLLLAMAMAGLVWSLYLLRIRQVTQRLQKLHDERIDERMRIAHELHDTLLQGFISASMQLHVTADTVPRSLPARAGLERILALMQRVTGEARDAVRGLRAPDVYGAADIDDAFARTAQELAGPAGPRFHVSTHGRPRRLKPLLRDEIYRIGRESLANAFRHSQASRIEVDVKYLPTEAVVVVRDDGRGIDPAVLHGGREGHWGLAGMRERAARMGARLSIRTPPGGGTEIELGVPGRIAYADVPPIGGFHRFAAWLGFGKPPAGGQDGAS